MNQTFDTRSEHDEHDLPSPVGAQRGRWLRIYVLCAVLGGCVVNPVPTPATGGNAAFDVSAAMDGGVTDAAVGGSDTSAAADTGSAASDASASDTSASDTSAASDTGLPGDATVSGDAGLSDDATQTDAD